MSSECKDELESALDLFCCQAQTYISSFFIISPRGSTILSKDFRGDLKYRNCVETFWQNIKSEEQQFESSALLKSNDLNQNGHYEPCSFFNINQISYIYYRNVHSIYYLMITKCNISPSFAIESLYKLKQSFCDYCGRRTMTEQSIRDNFILLYELVDEYFDNGYIQIPSVNDLLNLNVIYNQPTLDNLSEIWNLLLTADLITSHTDSSRHRSHNTAISSFAPPPHPTSTIIETPDKNQIFVDIVEYINVTAICSHNQQCTITNSSIHGIISMKVFLSNVQNDKKSKNNQSKNKKSKKIKKRLSKFRRNKNKKNEHIEEEKSKSHSPSVEETVFEYLSSLPPGIRLQFNDDLIIGRKNAPPCNRKFGALILDDVSFHKKVISSQQDLKDIINKKEDMLRIKAENRTYRPNKSQLSFIDNFAKKKILKFFVPNGEEFDIMNYRITSSFRDGSSRSRPSSKRNSPRDVDVDISSNPNGNKLKFPNTNSLSMEAQNDYIRIPFRIMPHFVINQDSPQSVPTIEFYVKIRADFPRQCVGRDVIVEFNVPNCVQTVSLQTKTGNKTKSENENKSNSKYKGPAISAPAVPGVGDVENNKLHKKNGHISSTLSDKELASIKQSAECIYIAHNARSSVFGIDLSSKYSMNDGLNAANIGIGKKRHLNPQRPQRKIVWRMDKFPHGIEQNLRCKFTLNYHHELTEKLLIENEDNVKKKEFNLLAFRKIVSPVAMKFQIDNYNVSALDIRSLRCIDWTSQRDDGGSNNGLYTTYRPYRWVRRITKSGSYVCRL